jgi:hypothetical protein
MITTETKKKGQHRARKNHKRKTRPNMEERMRGEK